MSLGENIDRLKESVAQTARRCGRRPEEIAILLVTKTVPPERIREAFQAGVHDFGENRVQELLKKKSELAFPIRWHMVGHLQTNKVKALLESAGATHAAPLLIHSLDRPELGRTIERQAGARGIERVPVLIQIKVSEEESKFGFAPEAVADFVAGIPEDSPLEIRGLMAVGPLTSDENQIRAAFRLARRCREEMARRFPEKKWDILSMGMSGDYRIAIEEGSTLIRIGTAVFGPRGSK